jgi:pimeloyl-ACP methyl ester carboxylesterase
MLAFAVLLSLLTIEAQAQSRPEYITLGRANGAVYRPAGGTPHTAFILMHRVADFMRHPGCEQLSERGFLALCMSPAAANNEAVVDWDQTLLDIKAGVEYLRKQPGITKVILFGHSGGGSVMAAYEATAEKGFAYCRGPGKIKQCGDKVAGLPPADGAVFADAHPSDGVMQMRDVNPSVVRSADGSIHVRADLDPFDPSNGFNPAGSHYSKEFQKRFSEAQAAMMGGFIEQAKKQEQDLKVNGFTYANEDMILVPTTKASAWLTRLDADFEGARKTIRPEKLLKNDGTVVKQVVTSVAVTTAPADVKTIETNYMTTNAFLTAHAVRGQDSQGQIDYCSTNAAAICAVQYVDAPIMVAAMGGYMFVRDGERLFDHAVTKDKDFVVIEGAVHGFTPCTACEKTPGQYSNTMKNLFDYVQDWTNRHFPS